MTGRRRVLVTGAGGEIASQILPELRRHYEPILLDVRATDRHGRLVPDVRLADLADADRVYRAIETTEIGDAGGVPWLVVYGISGNTRAFWSLENARRVLGYAPEDDSEITYADDIRRLLTGPEAGAPGGRVGA